MRCAREWCLAIRRSVRALGGGCDGRQGQCDRNDFVQLVFCFLADFAWLLLLLSVASFYLLVECDVAAAVASVGLLFVPAYS